VVWLRVFILLAEIGTLTKISENHTKTSVAFYAFNPLIILELTGNLHFEAVVILFLVDQ
jgi:hypothetical protein